MIRMVNRTMAVIDDGGDGHANNDSVIPIIITIAVILVIKIIIMIRRARTVMVIMVIKMIVMGTIMMMAKIVKMS